MAANQGYTGVVVSGSASTYQVQLNPQASTPGPTVTVSVLQIDPSEQIPAGTSLIVVQTQASPAKYVAQPPVWL